MVRILPYQKLTGNRSLTKFAEPLQPVFQRLLHSNTPVAKPSYAAYTWSPVGAEIPISHAKPE